MDKFMQRENIILGAAAPPVFSPNRSSEDFDFNDVFGGPPRRFSGQEVRVRHSSGGAMESEERTSSPWDFLKEKPVFGEDTVPRRRHTGNDFFDDIFGGDESHGSPKSNCDRDSVFGLSPSSRIMSPVRPSPLKHEPSATSLPSQFSLPAKLAKAMEPAFSSQRHGENRADSSAIGLRSPHSSSSLSRSPKQVVQGPDEIMGDVHFVYRQSPLSRQPSLVSEDLPSTAMSNQKGNLENLIKEIGNADGRGNEFHFSIYKWAGIGLPMLLPLLVGTNLKSKHKTKDDVHFSTIKKQDLAARRLGILKREQEKENRKRQEETNELQESIEEMFLKVPTLKSRSGLDGSVVFEENAKPLCKNDREESVENEISLKVKESLPSDAKPLLAWLSVEDEHSDEITKMKGNKTTIAEEVLVSVPDSKNVKKAERLRIDSTNDAEVHKSGVKGKVRELAQSFSQDAASLTKGDVLRKTQSYRWKADYARDNKKVTLNVAKEEGPVNLHHADEKPDDSKEVGEHLKHEEEKQYSPKKASNYESVDSSSDMKKASSSETLPKDPKILPEMDDDISVVDFLVEELSDDPENVAPTENIEVTRAINTKIKQWSTGKQGNIRSLLSTLQFVLWPGSGWKPVPLVDLIEANSVKRAYQKALLRLHPDKLQQKNAPFHQKYTAEKIFDILQEAWDHFNTLAPL